MTPVSRAEVEAKWLGLLDGSLTREDVCQWAEPLMLYAEIDDIMVKNALYYLHGFDLAYLDRPNLVHHGPPGTYVHSDEYIAEQLRAWRRRCEEYDRDPHAWRENVLQRARQFVAELRQAGKRSEPPATDTTK
jgi:hypothetical protein